MNQNDLNALPDDINQLKELVMSVRSDLVIQNKTIEDNSKTIEDNSKTINENSKAIKESRSEIVRLHEIIKLFQGKIFGKSSEKSPDQAELFDEVEVESLSPEDLMAYSAAEDVESEQIEPTIKSKVKSGRKPLPKKLKRIVIEHDLSNHEKICDCGCQKTHIGDEVSEQLDIIPAVIQVIQHRRKKYACKTCEGKIQVAALPPQAIPKSNASPGLLAHIAVAKYQDGLPLFRLEVIFARLGIHLPRNTMANWMIKCRELLQPLYNILNDQLLESGYIHMDETPVQVLNEPDKTAESKSYMWVRKTGDPNKPIVLFDYASSRKADVAQSLLPDYQGYLQTDDYAGYNKVAQTEGVTQLGCFAHTRRKFVDAQKVAPSIKGKVSKADMAVHLIAKLYAIEKEIKDKSIEERYEIRQKKSKPQLEKIKEWLDKSLRGTLPKGKSGIALSYMNKNWIKLTEYITDGRLNIDNNPVENAIRPFAIGRKNWLFSDSQKGADASAMLYSMIETAKANNIEPYQYLRAVFTKLPQAESVKDIEKLFPWNIELLES
jgi:transposase